MQNAVGVATACELDYRGVWVRVLVRTWISTPPFRPGRIWVPPSKAAEAWSWSLTSN
jgi:hypothetical protein